jgi:hypothetical protein
MSNLWISCATVMVATAPSWTTVYSPRLNFGPTVHRTSSKWNCGQSEGHGCHHYGGLFPPADHLSTSHYLRTCYLSRLLL